VHIIRACCEMAVGNLISMPTQWYHGQKMHIFESIVRHLTYMMKVSAQGNPIDWPDHSLTTTDRSIQLRARNLP